MTDGLPPWCVELVHDCHELIKNFADATANNVLSFRNFERHWKSINRKLMFDQHSVEDLPTLVNELYSVGKYFMFLKEPFASRVGGLYLLYALYFTQPTRNKIRFTLSEVKDLVSFLDEVKQGNMHEPLFTFYKLFVKNAFIFVATPNQFISQKNHSDKDVDTGNLLHRCKSGLLNANGLSSAELKDLETRLNKYQELKNQIPGFCTPNSEPVVDFLSEFQY